MHKVFFFKKTGLRSSRKMKRSDGRREPACLKAHLEANLIIWPTNSFGGLLRTGHGSGDGWLRVWACDCGGRRAAGGTAATESARAAIPRLARGRPPICFASRRGAQSRGRPICLASSLPASCSPAGYALQWGWLGGGGLPRSGWMWRTAVEVKHSG